MTKKKGQIFINPSQEVNPLVQNSNSLLEDLRRLNQLKDTSYKYDLDKNKVSSAKPKIILNTEKRKL